MELSVSSKDSKRSLIWSHFTYVYTTVLLLTMVQVLYLLEVFILAHYGPPSTETPTTESTTVWCHKNSWIYLTSTYYWWLLRPTITIRFDSKFQIIAQLFDSIPNEKKTIRTALLSVCLYVCLSVCISHSVCLSICLSGLCNMIR